MQPVTHRYVSFALLIVAHCPWIYGDTALHVLVAMRFRVNSKRTGMIDRWDFGMILKNDLNKIEKKERNETQN